MDDITKTQQSFARKALNQPEHRFEDVYHLICREDWIRFALAQVLGNKGSRTPGIDGVTRRMFDDEVFTAKFINNLCDMLKNGQYRPIPVKRIYIPKANGKKRPLGIPTLQDRVVQMLLKMLMEPIWESDFLDCSSGFRPRRRAMDCIALCYRLVSEKQKYFYAVEGDIKGCFDNIQHEILLKLVGKRIQDKKVLKLVEAFLKAGLMEGQLFRRTEEGTPQGGIVSPLLANIYLHEMDRYWWEKYGKLDSYDRVKRRHALHGNSRLIRYADDFLILTNGTKAEAERLRDEFQRFLWEELKLELSEEKTLITHANEGFDFLSFNVRRYKKPEKGTRPVTLVKPSKRSMERMKAKISLMTGHGHIKDHPLTKMQAVNSQLRGWINYFRHCNVKDVSYSLDYWVSRRILEWFADHHAGGVRDALGKYEEIDTRDGRNRKSFFVTDEKGRKVWLFKMSDVPVTRYVDKQRINPYLADWETNIEVNTEMPDMSLEHTWNGGDRWEGWTEHRLARLAFDDGKCVLCGATVNVDIHHINKRRWRRREHGDNSLANLRTLCEDCHYQVEKGEIILVDGTGAPDEVKVSRPVRRGA